MTAFNFCPRCATPLEDGPVDDGPSRRRCPAQGCGFVHWNNPIPVVAAVVEHQGDIILARNALWPPKMFALITGFLEKDDPHPESGVLREVEEELGLKGRIGEFIGHYPFERMNQIIIAYHVIAEGEINLGAELVEYRRVPPPQLRPWPAATGLALRDWMLRRGLEPQPYENEALRNIRDFHPIDLMLATAGQPTADQFFAVRVGGYQTVINLLPESSSSAVAGEREAVEAQGLRYHYLPVEWEAPKPEDFEQFCRIMQAEQGRRVFVHCAANKRVSAFVFLYRVLKQGVPPLRAQEDILRIWKPDEVWTRFIEERLGAG
jgi:protein tyrosine phosphatase (PTP) superfamily phosphohydrolase (DUF442 family)/8-oxo-dGTP pyrophosphatase MutT (NUDIX family)